MSLDHLTYYQEKPTFLQKIQSFNLKGCFITTFLSLVIPIRISINHQKSAIKTSSIQICYNRGTTIL